MVEKVIHTKKQEKWGFPQSYPRYPHPKWEKRGITRG